MAELRRSLGTGQGGNALMTCGGGLGQRESPGHGLEELVVVECWGASWWQVERCGRVGWEEKTER